MFRFIGSFIIFAIAHVWQECVHIYSTFTLLFIIMVCNYVNLPDHQDTESTTEEYWNWLQFKEFPDWRRC